MLPFSKARIEMELTFKKTMAKHLHDKANIWSFYPSGSEAHAQIFFLWIENFES